MLLLDVMDTLVQDPFYDLMPAFFGLSLDQLLAQKDPRAWVDFEFGAIDEATFFERFFSDRRLIDGAGLKSVARAGYRMIDGIEELLGQLHERGVEMHALSNYPTWYHEIEAVTGLSRFLKWSFVSCDMGLRKPDPQIYRVALERLGQPASACIFVDDRARNVIAAEAEGMHGILFDGAADLTARLRAFGI